jgi:protein O-mannosyl-transferase
MNLNVDGNTRRIILILVLLCAVTFASYSPVLWNDFISYDDQLYVTENQQVLGGLTWQGVGWAFRTGHASNWHPLTWISHMVDVQLFGLRPGWHHLVSLLLHTANAILVFLLLKRMTGAWWRSGLVAALFAVHPLHVESVAWIAERKDVLSTLFFLLTLMAYTRYAQTAGAQGSEAATDGARTALSASPREESTRGQGCPCSATAQEPRRELRTLQSGFSLPPSTFYFLSLCLFALGLMCKPMLVTMPGVLLLLDFWPLRRLDLSQSHFWRQLLLLAREKIPFICLAAISSLVTYAVQNQAHAVTMVLPFGLRAVNALVSYAKYLGKLFWPVNLAVLYPHPDIRFPVSNQWPLWAVLAATGLLAWLTFAALIRLKQAPWLAFGWSWFLGTLLPVMGASAGWR